jgi:hypothetical protein
MPAISKSFVTIADTATDPDSPIDAALITGLRDNAVHLREWMGASYTAGAVQDHNHDGGNSAAIEIGPNWLRNGNFENGTTGWTLTAYTGGTVTTGTSNEVEGTTGLVITSTNATNGGGKAESAGYIQVVGGQTRQFMVSIKASGTTVPVKAEVLWYDDALGSISASTIISVTTSPTTARLVVRRIAAPATARYCKVRLELPTGAGGTGTIYFDAVIVTTPQVLGGEEVFTGNGTFSQIWGDVFVQVQGGGAGCDSSTAGGGGGYAAGPVTTSGDVTVTVGGVAVNAVGGTSSFGSHMSGTGGTRGTGSAAVGGTGSGGSINITGGNGIAGGASFLSGAVATGLNGNNYGGGTQGTSGNLTGAAGVVIVRW